MLDRYNVQMFRRATKVSLCGPQYKDDLLPHIAKLHGLRELDLLDTSISDNDLEVWQKQHPQVVVTSRHSTLTR